MDFFGDDFGFSDSPRLKPNKNLSKKSQTNKSVKGGDDFDDLLDQLLDKEKKKTVKKANEIPSFNSMTSIDKIESPTRPQPNPPKKQQVVDSFSINLIKNESDFGKTYEPLRNRPSSRSIHNEDRGSQDNKSYKSGATGYAGFEQLDNKASINDDIPQFASSTRMMKPPLRKRAESKVGSEMGQDDMRANQLAPSLNQIESIQFTRPPLPKRDPSPPKQTTPQTFLSIRNLAETEVKPVPQIIQKQKVVFVKQENKNVRQEFDKQLKLIKQSHDKQVTHLRQELEKQIQSGRQLKLKMMRQFEEQREKDKQLYEMLAKKDSEKMKELYEWEIKRKSQSYELQIQRLKKFTEITMRNQPIVPSGIKIQPDRESQRIKDIEYEAKQRKLQQQETQLKQRQRTLQERETEFGTYRRRQEEKLQQERKELVKMESELRQKQLQLRKTIQQEKINMASALSKDQFEIAKQKEQVKLEKQQLEVGKQLFEKQKAQYQEFNAQIMKHYKQKLKTLQTERNHYQQRQIDLYKKIQTVEMVASLKAGGKREQKIRDNQENVDKNNNQKVTLITGQTRKDKKQQAREESYSPPPFQNLPKQGQRMEESLNKSTLLNAHKTNLQQYLLKVNKNNERKRPFLI